jgi:protein-S-isoprenylcysteine O-methyltransferase Ste14
MRRLSAILGSAFFLLLAPGMVAGVVPWWISHWRLQPPLLGLVAFRAAGVLLIIAAIPAVLDSFARFAIQGLGTPAPVFPTRHLVVTGLYGYVRNPMYVGVACAILGQALLLGDVRLLSYGILVWLAFHLFVIGYEEPTLRRSFGAEYEVFCKNVPRWIPRFKRWQGGAQP